MALSEKKKKICTYLFVVVLWQFIAPVFLYLLFRDIHISVFGDIIVAPIILYIFRKNYQKLSLKEILEAIVMAIGGFVIVAVILYFFPMKSLNQQMIEEILQTYPILSCLSAILFAPIVEEAIFRMMIFTLIKNRWVALATSTILFAFAYTINLVTIIPYLVVGFIMGIAYMRHGLTSATLTHMIYNALGIFI